MADTTITTNQAAPAASVSVEGLPSQPSMQRPAPPLWRPALDDLNEHVAHARALANMLAAIVSESGIGDGEDLNDHTGQTQQAFALLDGLESNLARIAQWMEDAEEAGGTKGQGGAA